MYNWIQKYFDLVYVITLPERKQHMTEVMNSVRINPSFFPAYLAKELNFAELQNRKLVLPTCNLTRGQVACHLSHCGVLSNFLENKKATSCLVFEDDISYPDKNLVSDKHFKKIFKELPDDWDVLYLGRCWDSCLKDKPVSPYIVKCFKPLCRHAIAFSRRGAEKVLELTLPMSRNPGDQMIRSLITSGVLNAYCLNPALFFQNREKFDSTLRLKSNAAPPECRGGRYITYEGYTDNYSPSCGNRYTVFLVLVIIYFFIRWAYPST
jgi:GR25 family glycosyltransferase involved in LPS biosynthesis